MLTKTSNFCKTS